MTKAIKFTKMHGAGNDYIYVDTTLCPIENPEKQAIEWSRFHTGIGSDGLILIGRSHKADFSMRIFNADGSEAMMCGNGSRCVGKYVYEQGLTKKTEVTLDTPAGIKQLKLHVNNGIVKAVTVDMGCPLSYQDICLEGVLDRTSKSVSMGNPHLITFVDDITTICLEKVGPQVEHHPLFPNRTNVEFGQIINDHTIRMRVWERGSGITQACGTGACATAVAAILDRRTQRKCDVIMDGGTVTIEWDETSGHVFMTGPAIRVFDGEIILPQEEA